MCGACDYLQIDLYPFLNAMLTLPIHHLQFRRCLHPSTDGPTAGARIQLPKCGKPEFGHQSGQKREPSLLDILQTFGVLPISPLQLSLLLMQVSELGGVMLMLSFSVLRAISLVFFTFLQRSLVRILQLHLGIL